MNATPLIVVLATAWGPKHGGINAFNAELLRSLGILPKRSFGLVCAVLNASPEDRADAARHHVELLSLGRSDLSDFPDDAKSAVLDALGDRKAGRRCVWLGHDNKSGALALSLRDAVDGSRAALIHHMAFGAYQDYKKGDGAAAKAKRDEQRKLFLRADLCFGVGPMLQEHLTDLLGAEPAPPPVEILVPGLAEPDPDAVRLGDQPPRNFTAFIAGRLGNEDVRQ